MRSKMMAGQAMAHYTRGDFAKAEKTLLALIDRDTRTHGPNYIEIAGSLLNLAEVHRSQEQLDEAQKCAEQAMTIASTNFDAEEPELARYYVARAVIRRHRNRFALAEDDINMAVRLIDSTELQPMPAMMVALWGTQADIFASTGRNEEAMDVSELALTLLKEEFPPNHREKALLHNTRGRALANLGFLDDCRREMNEALAIFRANSSDDFGQVVPLQVLAAIDYHNGHSERSLEGLQEIERLLRFRTDTAHHLNNVATAREAIQQGRPLPIFPPIADESDAVEAPKTAAPPAPVAQSAPSAQGPEPTRSTEGVERQIKVAPDWHSDVIVDSTMTTSGHLVTASAREIVIWHPGITEARTVAETPYAGTLAVVSQGDEIIAADSLGRLTSWTLDGEETLVSSAFGPSAIAAMADGVIALVPGDPVLSPQFMLVNYKSFEVDLDSWTTHLCDDRAEAILAVSQGWVVATADGGLAIRNIGPRVDLVGGHDGKVTTLANGPSGQIVSADEAGGLALWSSQGDLISRTGPPSASSGAVTAILANRLPAITVHADGIIRELGSGSEHQWREIATFPHGPIGAIHAVDNERVVLVAEHRLAVIPTR